MQKPLLIEVQYFAPIPVFLLMAGYEKICFEAKENYRKGSYRNRCYIAGTNGKLRLSVPLEKGKHQQTPIREVRISYTENWQKLHWNTLISAYRRSPYFEYYEDGLATFFNQPYETLFDLNLALTKWVMECLGMKAELNFTEEYEEVPTEFDDYRNVFLPGQDISRIFPQYQTPSYRQVFEEKNGFIRDLSVLDWMFTNSPFFPAPVLSTRTMP